ncbi:helix-turn-helix domain-containing protein [Coraliomargarita parva]|uniref:helix-turn-helix domain-containing protein n=1 Tax=Coraliomargarita parva TaxID=3014050 RepID=UPI0022B50877|nr:AraC family transcriptional regulator [Coraliomargarita parva]
MECLHYSNWCDLDSKLLWIYEGAPVLSRGRFRNQFLSAWCICEGSLRIGGAGGRRIEAGNWIFAPRSREPREFSEDAKIISLNFALRWPDGRMLFKFPEAIVVREACAPELGKAARRLLRFVQEQKLHARDMMRYQMLGLSAYMQLGRLFQHWLCQYVDLMEALGHGPVLSRHSDERILRLQGTLDRHALDVPIDLQGLAASVGLSFGHADHLFAGAFGMTMRAYFDRRRLLAAEHRLREGLDPVKRIAYELGFQDATAFSHWFKKKSGLSPRAFRKAEV